MTANQKKANESFLNGVIKFSKMWIWPDENLYFEITNNKLVVDTPQKKNSLSKIVSRKWFLKNTLN